MAKGFWKLELMSVDFCCCCSSEDGSATIGAMIRSSSSILNKFHMITQHFLILTIKSFKQKHFQDYIFFKNCYGIYQKYLSTNISLCMPVCFAHSSVVHMFMCACV